ncbi:putative choline dehydrogenase protein [Botrytis fragariae]|uniref:Putative choline dehydrogenase protein n=1 Tax=Botrytis fragariae TaxID=1964551 RepID=A0A8H6AJP6_9HELO|nr:putative choline dehydrogenase protein [Botrytis fragariae]KAF5868609.1 putative choline dehydrogenase protein [Botrytis fragariae]
MFPKRSLSLVALFSLTASAFKSQHTHQHLHQRTANATSSSANITLDPYEYVVVGSGPGGAPLAARLALAGHSVLLIDAGEDHGDDIEMQVPALHVLASEYDPIRWDFFVQHYANETRQARDSKMTYQTADGDFYVGLDPPEGATPLGILYPRTGTLGGCAEHNALITILPQETDWQYIQNVTGDDSWAPAKMREYYKKLESCHYLSADVTGHGFDGWLQTEVTNPELIVQDQKVLSLVIAAATTMGKGLLGGLITTVTGLAEVLALDINNDSPNRDQVDALYQVPLAMKFPEYSRSSPRDFVWSVANATNSDGSKKYKLDVQLNTLVTKVQFNTTAATPRATGVEFIVGKSLYRADPRSKNVDDSEGTYGSVTATKEVIVSGGTFNTPQILKLSGVGPKAELEKFGIPVIVDLPGVGTNMQDRYEVGIVGNSTSDFSLLKECTFLNGTDPCLEQWETLPLLKGGYSTNGIAIAYPKHSSVADGVQDLYLGGVPAYFNGYFPGYSVHALAKRNIWTWLTLKAHSRNNAGTVNLRSADPRDTPEIVFNYFETGVGGDEDLQAVYEGMKFGIEAFENLIPLDGSFTRIWPDESITSEEDLKQFALDEAWGHHASCSCPIGADDDEMAVLDTNFKVRGVDGLRVVDASVFPKIPGMYIALSIYMISEKAADVILAEASS